MANFSFDVVSTYDKAEMNNAVEQAQREIENRYDFKGTAAAIEWLGADRALMERHHQIDLDTGRVSADQAPVPMRLIVIASSIVAAAGTGRDAADVSFATIFGPVKAMAPVISAPVASLIRRLPQT